MAPLNTRLEYALFQQEPADVGAPYEECSFCAAVTGWWYLDGVTPVCAACQPLYTTTECNHAATRDDRTELLVQELARASRRDDRVRDWAVLHVRALRSWITRNPEPVKSDGVFAWMVWDTARISWQSQYAADNPKPATSLAEMAERTDPADWGWA
jgi:hypothetical protein